MEDDKGGINGEDGNLTWCGEYTIQCTDNVLWNCAPETYIILLISVTPIHSIKRKILKIKYKNKKDPKLI